jgi:hypothetical protein
MKRTLTAVSVGVLGLTPITFAAYAAAEKWQGQTRGYQILSEVSSPVPGQEGHALKQYSTAFQLINTTNPALSGISLQVSHEEIVGNDIAAKGYATTKSSNGMEIYWSFSGTGKVKEGTYQGTFQWTGGTGKFKNLKGNGEYSCKFGPDTMNGCDWSSQAEGLEGM